MNISRIGGRLAISGVATAIAAAGLVGASATTANAVDATKTGTSTYSCTFPSVLGLPAQDLPVDMTIPNVSGAFPAIPAGLPLAQGSLNASYLFHVGAVAAPLLSQVTG